MTKPHEIKIETAKGVVAILDNGEKMREAAKDWNYKLASRSRWAHNPKRRKEMQLAATKAIKDLGLTDAERRKIAIAGVVEVSIPFQSGSKADEALIMPWEYLLSAATKEYRGDYSICVVRYLDNQADVAYPKRDAEKFGFVETAPGMFSEVYKDKYQAERDMVSATLGNLCDVGVPVNPSIKQLKKMWKAECPEVLHVTGIDLRLGADLMGQLTKEMMDLFAQFDESKKTENKEELKKDKTKVSREVRNIKNKSDDGLYFAATENGEGDVFAAPEVAAALAPGDTKPLLIGLNCAYSGGRIAAHCVAAGARTAIGLQAEVDNRLSERFFVRFYQAWLNSDQDSLAAFIEAWEFVKPMGMLTKGTGLILWSGQSMFDKRRSPKWVEPNLKGITSIKSKLSQDKQQLAKTAVVADPAVDKIRDLVGVKVVPNDVVNYCMLQNGQSVLKELYFWFKKIVPASEPAGDQDGEAKKSPRNVDCVRDIEVEVLLKAGTDSIPYKTRISLGTNSPQLSLADNRLAATDENPGGGINIPLMSDFMRSVAENIKTSLYVNVEWEGQVLFRHTFGVTLAPVDEWRLGEKDSLLIPAFVQPRDPIIVKIVDAAQKYLHCINKDPKKGFDGYQSDSVHSYLEAIWSALIYDYRLEYVSPPPSSNVGTQRLRTPSEVIAGKRGTCVELAILLASCIEWVELYPVIIMSEVHAFVGCWSSHEAHEEFVSLAKKKPVSRDEQLIKSRYPWVTMAGDFKELELQIRKQNIVPMEAIALTWYYRYQDARDWALQYFGVDDIETAMEYEVDNLVPVVDDAGDEMNIYKFESMIDIYSSRDYVSPIPVSRH